MEVASQKAPAFPVFPMALTVSRPQFTFILNSLYLGSTFPNTSHQEHKIQSEHLFFPSFTISSKLCATTSFRPMGLCELKAYFTYSSRLPTKSFLLHATCMTNCPPSSARKDTTPGVLSKPQNWKSYGPKSCSQLWQR